MGEGYSMWGRKGDGVRQNVDEMVTDGDGTVTIFGGRDRRSGRGTIGS